MKLVDVYALDGAPQILYEICKERRSENNTNISFEMPSWEEHLKFIKSKPYAYWGLIFDEKYHGYVSLTGRNEIGIVLFKSSRGKGIGKQALQLFMNTHIPLLAKTTERRGKWIANINPDNEISKKLFQSLGFKHIQETYAKP